MAKGKENKAADEEEIEIIEVPDESDKKVAKGAKEAEEDDDDADEEDGEGEDTEASDEERLGHSESEEEAKPKKRYSEMTPEEKKEWKANKKKRQREARERDQKEMNFLRKRNENLEKRFSEIELRQNQNEVVTIDQRIGQLKAQIDVADEVIAKAIENQAGEDVVAAQKIRGELVDAVKYLETEKGRKEGGKTKNEVDPEIRAQADAWRSKTSWWDPAGTDTDSRIVRMVDAELSKDSNFNPRTQAYWDELSKRCARYLPHRYKKQAASDDDEGEEEETPPPKKRAGGPKMSAGGGTVVLGKNQVAVSAERRAALEEMGVWDDPKLRARYLKSYAAYDREAAQNKNS